MTEATPLRLGTEQFTVRVSSHESGGALLAIDVTMPPGGGPPVMHRHAHAELYLVRDGELTFYVEDTDGHVHRRTAGTGEVVPIPGGAAHTIRNESDRPSSAFTVHAPGAAMDGFVHAAAALTEPDVPAVLALAERHGIEMLSPPPARTAQ